MIRTGYIAVDLFFHCLWQRKNGNLTMRTQIYAGEALARYGFPGGHPFSTQRFVAFYDEFLRRDLQKRTVVVDPVTGDPEILRTFHSEAYVSLVERSSRAGRGLLDHGDTPAFPGCFEAALTVCATAVAATDAIMTGASDAAFVPIAGLHHARRDTAGGFCIFNDAGIVIERLLAKYGLLRIAYVDIDAHHGDGVYYEFEGNPHVIFADLHQQHIYPGTGDADETGLGEALGIKLNIPMRAGADDVDFNRAWHGVLEHLRAARPEFIILQCGADSIKGDPITQMAYTPTSFRRAGHDLAALAREHAEGRLLALGGGGYNLSNIGLGWNNVIEGVLSPN
jgi:acetoin utilization protein AcuC